MRARHLSKVLDWLEAECGELLAPDDTLPTSNEDAVECKACLAIMAQRGPEAVHFIHRVKWDQTNSAPYKCGALGGPGTLASSSRDSVNCPECLALMGGGTSTPLQFPPYMADNDDGLFVFFDSKHGKDVRLEVVPQLSGNVEMSVSWPEGDVMFSLSHLDRANLLRALLHDFHYSPERGGPNDQV